MLSVTLVLVLILLVYSQSHVLASVTVDMSDYDEVLPNLYVDSLFSKEGRERAVLTYSEARKRVFRTYGELVSSPVVIIASNAKRGEKFGIKLPVPGMTYVLPLSQYIVLNNEGNNVDVLAHELAHAETADRVGYLKWTINLPIWFVEGVAMQVDYRERYVSKGIELPSVSTLSSVNEFNSGDITLHYTSAKYEIASWLASASNEGLYSFLARAREGEEFDDLYEEYGVANK